jgi:hypothetical protein
MSGRIPVALACKKHTLHVCAMNNSLRMYDKGWKVQDIHNSAEPSGGLPPKGRPGSTIPQQHVVQVASSAQYVKPSHSTCLHAIQIASSDQYVQPSHIAPACAPHSMHGVP